MKTVPPIRRYLARIRVEGECQVVIEAENEEEARKAAASTRLLKQEDAVCGLTTHLALGPTNWTMELLLQLKYKFGVSAETFAHRLEKIGVLAPALRKRFKEELRNYYEEHDNAEPSPTIKPLQADSRLKLLKLRTAQ